MILDGFLFAIGATLGFALTYTVMGALYEMYSDWQWDRRWKKDKKK